ncbi:hypothetical protein BZA77DRAFT_310981 [Pyronema omphalodes]|nr:hypothetical protein BZA77DRAFT_310981 [Pyronema omphalodes]
MFPTPTKQLYSTSLPESVFLENYGGIICGGSSDEEDTVDQTERILKKARDYLRGDELFIQTASLKGPFIKNPWRKQRKPTRQKAIKFQAESSPNLHTTATTKLAPTSENPRISDFFTSGKNNASRADNRGLKSTFLPFNESSSRIRLHISPPRNHHSDDFTLGDTSSRNSRISKERNPNTINRTNRPSTPVGIEVSMRWISSKDPEARHLRSPRHPSSSPPSTPSSFSSDSQSCSLSPSPHWKDLSPVPIIKKTTPVISRKSASTLAINSTTGRNTPSSRRPTTSPNVTRNPQPPTGTKRKQREGEEKPVLRESVHPTTAKISKPLPLSATATSKSAREPARPALTAQSISSTTTTISRTTNKPSISEHDVNMAAPTTITKTRILRSTDKKIQTVTPEVDWNKKRPKIDFSAASPAVKLDERPRAKRRKVSQTKESTEAPKRVTRGATKRVEKAEEPGDVETEEKESSTQERRRSSMLLSIRETSVQVGTPPSAKDMHIAEAVVNEVKGPMEQQERQEGVVDVAPVEAPATEPIKPTEEAKESNAEIQMEIQTETTVQVERTITTDHPPATNAVPAPATEAQTTPYQSTQMQLSAARNFFLDAMAESPIRFDTFNTPKCDNQKPSPTSAHTKSPSSNLAATFMPEPSTVPSEPTPVPAPKTSLSPPQLPPLPFGGSAPDTSLGGGLGGGFTIHTSPKHTPQQQNISRGFTPINVRWSSAENGFTQGTQNMFPDISPPKPEDFLPPPTTPGGKPSDGFSTSNNKSIYRLSPPYPGNSALPLKTPNADRFSPPFEPAENVKKSNTSPAKSSKASTPKKSTESSKRSNNDGFIHYTPVHPPLHAPPQVTATPAISKTKPFTFHPPYAPPQVTATPGTSRKNDPFEFPTPKPLPQVTATPGFTPAPNLPHEPQVTATPAANLQVQATPRTTETIKSNNPFAFSTPALPDWNTSSSPKGPENELQFRSSQPAAVTVGTEVEVTSTVKKAVGFSAFSSPEEKAKEKEKEKEKEDEQPLNNTADTDIATQPNTYPSGMLSLSYMPDTQKASSQTSSYLHNDTQKPFSQTPSGYPEFPGFPEFSSGPSEFPDHQQPLSLHFSPDVSTHPHPYPIDNDNDTTKPFDIPSFLEDDEPSTSLADNEDVKNALNILGPGWCIDDDLRAMAGTSTPPPPNHHSSGMKKGKVRMGVVGKKNRWV